MKRKAPRFCNVPPLATERKPLGTLKSLLSENCYPSPELHCFERPGFTSWLPAPTSKKFGLTCDQLGGRSLSQRPAILKNQRRRPRRCQNFSVVVPQEIWKKQLPEIYFSEIVSSGIIWFTMSIKVFSNFPFNFIFDLLVFKKILFSFHIFVNFLVFLLILKVRCWNLPNGTQLLSISLFRLLSVYFIYLDALLLGTYIFIVIRSSW